MKFRVDLSKKNTLFVKQRWDEYSIQEKPANTVLITGFRHNQVTESYVKAKFSDYGEIQSVKLLRDLSTGIFMGFASVEYVDYSMARKAVNCAQSDFIVKYDKNCQIYEEQKKSLSRMKNETPEYSIRKEDKRRQENKRGERINRIYPCLKISLKCIPRSFDKEDIRKAFIDVSIYQTKYLLRRQLQRVILKDLIFDWCGPVIDSFLNRHFPKPEQEQDNSKFPLALKNNIDIRKLGKSKTSKTKQVNKEYEESSDSEPENIINKPALPLIDQVKDHVKCETGCARTEGIFQFSKKQKIEFQRLKVETLKKSENLNANHSTRDQRRLNRQLLHPGQGNSDLMKYNSMRMRKKNLKFDKSMIHAWGLFTLEQIDQGDMIIEYVGEIVRAIVAEAREKRYEKEGIGSSYLFRVDDELVVDATKKGNLARFINHSCDPNCVAKIITIENQKKIVFYAKKAIQVGEEITYDYKFPREEKKIPCCCGSSKCRGSLN
ncbi:SET domain-containing protein [Rozella allomycis CSF55]|uniref:[histone H3]-lysine(4) N-trimethyltransferase n=1 Tax=Rozella allomycis (strain CSF55) TaxID=988480 RepID=A0A4V1J057_ROZAC|nr:SET domain-containing protein [Rozella allomycis CSF55]